jgi:hypothetical protein
MEESAYSVTVEVSEYARCCPRTEESWKRPKHPQDPHASGSSSTSRSVLPWSRCAKVMQTFPERSGIDRGDRASPRRPRRPPQGLWRAAAAAKLRGRGARQKNPRLRRLSTQQRSRSSRQRQKWT